MDIYSKIPSEVKNGRRNDPIGSLIARINIMKLSSSIPTLLVASACLLAQPNIRDVRNAAGNLNPGLPGYGIAPGSLISIAGSTASDAQSASFPLTTSLNGVSVKISAGGQDVDALMVSITSSRILALVPSQTPKGTGTVKVTDANGTSSAPIIIVDRNFGIFTQKSTSTSAGAAFAVNLSDGGNTSNTLTTPAMPGQQIVILGSGAGPTTQDETNAVSDESLSGDFALYIGGQLATITSTGRSGLGVDALGLTAGLAGVDSIVAMVPAGVAGCRVSVVAVTSGKLASNFATISVSPDGSTCSDPGFISADDINNLPASGTYNVGVISMTRFTISFTQPPLGTIDINSDSAVTSYQQVDVNDFRSTLGGSYTSMGSCVVYFTTADGSGLDNAVVPKLLDAGSAITLKGPKATVVMNRTGAGEYAPASATGSNSPLFPPQGTPFVDPGAFDANNGGGGADVKGFTANLTNPTPLTWTNQAKITDVTRTDGVTVTWTGGASDGAVIISGASSGAGKVSAGFACTAPASAGTFIVPPAVTLSLPASTANNGGILILFTTASSKFTAQGLDQGLFTSSSGSAKNLNYR